MEGSKVYIMVLKQAKMELECRAKWNAIFAMYELERTDSEKPNVWYLRCVR